MLCEGLWPQEGSGSSSALLILSLPPPRVLLPPDPLSLPPLPSPHSCLTSWLLS